MFDLKPFKASSQTSKIKIHAEAFKDKGDLCVTFLVEDPSHVVLWGNAEKAIRTHELWKTTCFELFLSVEGSDEYWELNLSPHGAWNLYHFDSYRNTVEPRQEDKVSKINFQKSDEVSQKKIEARIPIQGLGLLSKTLEVSITSVIEFKDKEKAYFALKHVTDKPDFHQRDSFICSLE